VGWLLDFLCSQCIITNKFLLCSQHVPSSTSLCPKLWFSKSLLQTEALQQQSGLEVFLLGGGMAND
jgi:hypothetical protein